MYMAKAGVYVGRPPCDNCHAAYRLHRDGTCPEPWRPDTLAEARHSLSRAMQLGDEAAIFVARGEVQRLEGRKP